MLSVLIFVFPPLYGEGYDTISSLLNGQFSHIMDKSMFYGLNDTYWGLQLFLTLILLFKVFASSATNAGGGCGGIFAPSLYLGCIAGFVFAHASNFFPFTMYLSEKNFALLGMAGIMSGVMHAPLTGVFLIDRWLRAFPSADDCLGQLLYNDQDVPAPQYLLDASGPERRVADPS